MVDAYARFNAGDHTPEPWFFHPDAEYHVSSSDPDSAVNRGLNAIGRQYARWLEAYPDLRVEPLEVKDKGDHVFVWARFSGQGASSGVPIDIELAHVHTLRDGRVARIVEFTDRDEALAAVGLDR